MLNLIYRTNDLDDRSSAAWCFLSWVAYDRNLAGPTQITDDERLRCPILWCRRRCDDQNKLLEHVFRCAHYSNGWYWCFHCQKEESFASCQCKNCQAPAFGKERLSVRVKRLFRSLGTKSHQKDHEPPDPSAAFKGTSGNANNQCSECLPPYGGVVPVAIELDGNKVLRELKADYIPGPAELNGFSSLPAELYSESAMASTFKQDVSCSRSECHIYPVDNEATGFASLYASMKAVQALPLPSSDIREPPSQFRMDRTFKLAVPEDSLPQPQSPVSPQNAECISTSYTDTISESPTNIDFSGFSNVTGSFDSGISPPSTRNSTMQSFSRSSFTVEKPSDYQSTLPIMHDVTNEMPNFITKEECSRQGQHQGQHQGQRQGQAGSIRADASHSSERRGSTRLGSRTWLTRNHLLNDFWKVLTLHVVESLERLKVLLDCPAKNELLSMAASTVAYMGLAAWQRTLKGYFPTTIAHLYSLVHVTYACAIVIYDGQVENQLRGLFTQSLSIGIGALSEEDKWIYTSIAWSIWSPPEENVHLHPFASAESTAQAVQPPSGQSCANGKAPLRMIGVSDRVAQFLHMKEAPSTVKLHSNKDNEILNMLNHFQDSKSECAPNRTFSGDKSNSFRRHYFLQRSPVGSWKTIKPFQR